MMIEREDIVWEDRGEGYKSAAYKSFYGGVAQRWLLIFSEQAFQREKKILEKKLEKEKEELERAVWHFGNQEFHCEEDAHKAFEEMKKKYKFHQLKGEIVAVSKYVGRGRPKKGMEKVTVSYRVREVLSNLNKIRKKIILLFGKTAAWIYGLHELIPKKPIMGLGM